MNDKYYTAFDMNNNDRNDSLTLEILETINNKSDVTQRHIAKNLGVALGLANSYLKRCVNKGFIKIKQVPTNRYLYYLTPNGFAEKSRLTARYLTRSFDFYRDASGSFVKLYNECMIKEWKFLLFCGASELAEIAYIRAQEFDIEIIGTFDIEYKKDLFLGTPVWKQLADLPEIDTCLLTSFEDIETTYNNLSKKFKPEIILIPDILGFRPNN